jgi:nucleotide sugar dehydrogenase
MKTIGIIGCGYIGKHLIDIFSKEFNVIGIDGNSNTINTLKSKYTNSNFYIKPELLSTCDLICIAIPTKFIHNQIDKTTFIKVINNIKLYAKKKTTIVIESCINVGFTRELLEPLLKDYYCGFSPERTSSKNISYNKIPKIIAGLNTESLIHIKNFYLNTFDTVVEASNVETAEFCKLYENCFKVINIAYSNQSKDMCDKYGINFDEVLNICSSKPHDFIPFYSSLGITSDYLPNNVTLITSKYKLPIVNVACKYLEDRPYNKAVEFFNNNLYIKCVLIIGMGLISDSSIIINSPGLRFANELIKFNKKIKIYFLDPFISQINNIISENEAIDKIHTGIINAVCVTTKQKNLNLDKIKDVCNNKSIPYIIY